MSELTKDEIMAELSEIGVKFNKRDSKDKLAELLKSQAASDAVEGELMPEKTGYLKNIHTGRIFQSTPKLAQMDFMVEATQAEIDKK